MTARSIAMMKHIQTAIGGSSLMAVFVIALIGIVTLISTQTGALMGKRAFDTHPAVEVVAIAVEDALVSLTLQSNTLYPLTAVWGFSVVAPTGETIFQSDEFRVEGIQARTQQVVQAPLPNGMALTDQQVQAWAREWIAYVDSEDGRENIPVEPRAAVRRAPLSMEALTLRSNINGTQIIDVGLSLTGNTQSPILLRYALSLTSVIPQPNGAVAPIERVYFSPFTSFELIPNETREINAVIEVSLDPGLYAGTLWVQRETEEAGVFEHFSQFTYPDLLTITP